MPKLTSKTFAEAVVFDNSVNDFCQKAVDHCYNQWKISYGDYTEQYFIDHLEVVYGVKLDRSGGYYVVDERKYLLFRMKFSDSYNKEQGPQGPGPCPIGPPGLTGPNGTI